MATGSDQFIDKICSCQSVFHNQPEPFRGIMVHLTRKGSGNVGDHGVVDVTASRRQVVVNRETGSFYFYEAEERISTAMHQSDELLDKIMPGSSWKFSSEVMGN